MDTAEWAEEADAFLTSYHQFVCQEIVSNDIVSSKISGVPEISSSIQNRYFDEWDVRIVQELVQKNPVIRSINVKNLEASPFELFESARGWQPVLRRIPRVYDSRIVTIARRSLCVSLKDPDNLFLVSRQQWSLLELLRHAQGLYQEKSVLDVLKKDVQARNNKINGDDDDTQQHLKIVTSEGAEGRHVVFDSKSSSSSLSPGDILHSADPFIATPYDFGPHSSCFHCAKDLLGANGASLSSVKELSLQCCTCQVSSLSYCSVSCRQNYQAVHARECPWIQEMAEKCETTGMAPFKVLLVLRAALRAKNQPSEFAKIQELESHLQIHEEKKPEYTSLSRDFAHWMVDEILTESELEAITDSKNNKSSIDCLVHMFLTIPINAISLGPNAVGFFPGLPSMFNHSCLENVTHSWDDNNKLVFRAVQTIPNGSECCFSYIHGLNLPTVERTQALQDHKFFTCSCVRCCSPDEEGRLSAIETWNRVTTALEGEESSTMTILLFRQKLEVAEVLFPPYSVTKGLIMEELAHALVDSQNAPAIQEGIQWLLQAKEQYSICRGQSSKLVVRVNTALDIVSPDFTEFSSENEDITEQQSKSDNDDDNADLILVEGWNQVLFEVKTYEALDDLGLQALSDSIKKVGGDDKVVKWAPGHRTYEIGYGLRSLILSCRLNHSLQSKEELVDILEERFEDNIQHVDLIISTL